jgi:hypothetical protein
MKCPKCGYNSFEFYDSCKKCANDLTGYKITHGIKPIVLPLEARTSLAEALIAENALNEQKPEASEEHVDMFSFDVPADQSTRSNSDDPFNFDDEPIAPPQAGGEFSFDEGQQSAQAKAEEEAFADLLESTSQEDKSSKATLSGADADRTGEADLSSFSWDDTSNGAVTTSTKTVEDDFNSLFGNMDDPAKK